MAITITRSTDDTKGALRYLLTLEFDAVKEENPHMYYQDCKSTPQRVQQHPNEPLLSTKTIPTASKLQCKDEDPIHAANYAILVQYFPSYTTLAQPRTREERRTVTAVNK
ncbi:hypothetical protein FRC15_008697 [Serendipita sp. 397]|nr:hypothetical protein FRC15_008697 [Serendipita sp. 397]